MTRRDFFSFTFLNVCGLSLPKSTLAISMDESRMLSSSSVPFIEVGYFDQVILGGVLYNKNQFVKLSFPPSDKTLQ